MLAYALLLPTAVGFLFVTYFSPVAEKNAVLERILLGFGIGSGMLTFEMFIIGLLRVPFTVFVISAMQIATVILLLYLLYQRKVLFRQMIELAPYGSEEKAVQKMSGVQIVIVVLLSAWILLKLLYVLYEGSIWPIFAFDSVANWSSGAKFFFYNKGLALNLSQEHYFGKGYRTFQEYPLHIPLLQTWIALCLGDFHEVYVKIYNVFYYWCIVGLTFFALKRHASTVKSLVAAFFVSTVPLLTYHASEAYADLPLSYYALCAIIYFQRYTEMHETEANAKTKNGLLWIMGTAVAIGSWTKGEGILFTAAFTLALIVYLFRKRMLKVAWKDITCYVIPILAVAIPWHIFLAVKDIWSGRGYENILAWGLHFEVLPVILGQFIMAANFNIIFVFFLLLLIFGWKPILHAELYYLLIPLGAVMAFFVFVYLTTDNYVFVVDLTAVNRNSMTFIPMMYYVASLLAVRVLSYYEKDRTFS